MNTLTVCFNNMFANSQAQPGATHIAAAATVSSVKALKYAVQVFFGNAHSVVAYFNQYMFFIGLVYTGYNVSILLAVFGGIFYQV